MMADQTPMNEMLSALTDGETNEFELRRLLREIEQQTEEQALQKGGEDTLSEQWRRLHVLRSVLRNEVDSEGRSLPAADISAAVAKTIAGEDVDWLVPHQANKRIIDAAASRMKLPDEKVMMNIHKYGNTTSATLPLCLADYEKQLKKGDNLIFASFGGGFTWGAVYLKWAYDSK